MPVQVERLPQYDILYNPPPETNLIVCIGGRGGAKTYEVSKYIAYSTTIKKKRAVILRDEQALIKETILNEIWTRYDTANEHGRLDRECIKNETELKDRKTGKTLLYTKGFRATSLVKTANMKGPSDIDIAVVEEGEDIRDKQMFDTFVDGLRKEGCIVIIMLNTPNLAHFIVKRLFNATPVLDDKGEPTGYFKLSPKDIPGFVCIQTDYTMNPFLTPNIIARYKGYGDPTHHLYDFHHYMTAILGYASTGRKGQIFTKVKPIPLAKYLLLPFKEYYGQDFGTASPAALIGAKFDGNTVYIRLLNYLPMDVLSLAKLYSTLKFDPTDRIVCDYADPISISKLANGFQDLSDDEYMKYPELANGFYAVKCPTKDITGHISLMKSMRMYAVEEDEMLWEEINNYVYAQDKFKNYTDDPIDDFNHALDAARYLIADQRGAGEMKAY
jgi:phage terminase large subunit